MPQLQITNANLVKYAQRVEFSSLEYKVTNDTTEEWVRSEDAFEQKGAKAKKFEVRNNVCDLADPKKVFSTYLRTLPACERLKMTIALVYLIRDQDLHILKSMWALCEVVKEK